MYRPMHFEFAANRPNRPPFILDKLFLMMFTSLIAAPQARNTWFETRGFATVLGSDKGSAASEEPTPEIRKSIKLSGRQDCTHSTILSPARMLFASGSGCPATMTSYLTTAGERRSVTRSPRVK